MFYLKSLIWILCISGLLVIVLKKKFGFVCTIAFLIGSFSLYLSGFINNIRIGYYLTWILVGLFIGIIVYWRIKKEKHKLNEFKENYFTLGFFAFLILCIYAFLLFFKQGFSYCDEFTHWGPMTISTIKSNAFYSVPDSLLTFHKDYPPLFTLLEVLWCGFDGFHFSETYCYIALSTFMFSCFLPAFDRLNIRNKKDWLKSIVIILCVVLVGITIDKTTTAQEYAFVYNSIYTDWPLAVFSAFLIFSIYKEKEWNTYIFVLLTISLSTLPLMKQMGLCFYLIVLFYAFIKILFIDKKLNKKRLVIGIICFALIPILTYFSWQYIIKLYELQGQFVISELDFSEVLNIARGDTEYPWKQEAYANFLYEIVNRKLVLHPFEMSYFVYVGLLILIILIVYKFNKDSMFISGTYLIGSCGYALTMLLLYMLAYDIYEAPRLASFDRYMSSYLYLGSVLVLLLCLDRILEKNRRIATIECVLTMLVLLLFIEPKSISTIIPRFSVNNEPKKVLVVKQFNSFEPNRERLNGLEFVFTDDGYVNEESMDFNKWKQLLLDHDLLYVVGYDEFIYDELWLPLNQEAYLWNDSLYIINKENSNIVIDYQMEQFYDYVMNYYLMDK